MFHIQNTIFLRRKIIVLYFLIKDIVVSSEFADMVEKLIDYRMSPLFAPLDMLMDLPPSKIYVCTRDVLGTVDEKF